MRDLLERSVLLAAVLLIILSGPGAAPAALGADCGDGVGPCRCGDRVVTNTRLDGSDPVLQTVCPCNGLTVASGVTLDIGGTIRGQCLGIRLESGAMDVVVKNGRLFGFGIGIEGEAITGAHISKLQILDSNFGIHLFGRGNVIESNVIRRATIGMFVAGSRNTVRLSRVEDTDGLGIQVVPWFGENTGNVVARNVVLRSAGVGIFSTGSHAIVDRNQSKFNLEGGFQIGGVGVQVTRNIAAQNHTPGFFIDTVSGTISRNRSHDNATRFFPGLGIFDNTFGIGGGTAGTANVYTDNGCTGNEVAPSDPPGLCF